MADYNLDSLGWFQFEHLCQALLRAGHGASIEMWGGSSDRGRDAYAAGPLRFPDPLVEKNGPFIFQAKFVSNSILLGEKAATALKKAVRLEAAEIRKRIGFKKWTQPRYYALLSNVVANEALRKEVEVILRPVLPDAEIILIGRGELSRDIDRFESIRVAYPQILGLTDLRALISAAVNASVRHRSTLSIDIAVDLAPVFVPTEAYNAAFARLSRRSFAVLLGPPEMGKTAIARTIALALHTRGWEAIDCRQPEDVFKVYDADARQVFIADDAFGSTEYRPDIATEWAADLEKLVRMMNSDHYLIWTSRPAPLREGLRQLHLQGVGEDFPKAQEVEVNASQLTTEEKAQMLYRHAKAAELGERATSLVRYCARRIVESEHFTPLRIKRFVQRDLPGLVELPEAESVDALEEAVEDGLREPTSAMATSFNVLPEELRALLLAMLNSPSGPVEMAELRSAVEAFLGRPPEVNIEVMVGLLVDHFVRRVRT